MDVRQLEYIVHLADRQVLARVAEELYVSPSALSQYVAKLENELGTPLFKRIKGAWPLTNAGRVYVETAREILKRYHQMKKDINDIIDCTSGEITVGISSNKASRMFTHIFPQFKGTYPNITVKLTDGHTKDLFSQVEKGLLDIVFSTSGIETSALIYRPLLHERFVLTVPKTHHLAYLANPSEDKLATIDLNLFCNDYFMLANPSMTIRIITDNMFTKAGFLPKILLECNSAPTLYTLSESGYGVSIIPMGNMNPSSASVYFLTNPLGEWDNIVAYAQGSRLSKAEEYFIELAQEYYATHFTHINI
ncbi:MAG: LysR family transcriptional regulator [Spirochaetales bacterium]|jgi:DNA-binding transcriptional LysR family regulator|nr:LysR family transcriptional regulator [Spirochaetales bacterium]